MWGKHPFQWLVAVKVGSPQHASGKHRRTVSMEGLAGITPTCVGKTTSLTDDRCASRDHPNFCRERYLSAHSRSLPRITPPKGGKTADVVEKDFQPRGSPQRSSGNLKKIPAIFTTRRITPTCVRKTSFQTCFQALAKDHPNISREN